LELRIHSRQWMQQVPAISAVRAGSLWNDDLVESALIPSGIRASLGDLADDWIITASTSSDGSWIVKLDHPASAGKVLETGASAELDALQVAQRWLADDDEIRIVAAAPPLIHADLCLGVRTLTMVFSWHNREVRGVTFLMHEHGHLTERETAWLAGYVGEGAPGKPASPLG